MIKEFEEEKQKLKGKLFALIDELEAEEKNQRDTMNWSGEGNNRMVWRIKPESAHDIKLKLIRKINEYL